ncbi:hypothetical protein tb265_01690 [Gemmatimonadetes bacterium T265]|nr:hypothetical protein tb265_01690 [Gemmatimonadetes bacterium T265]
MAMAELTADAVRAAAEACAAAWGTARLAAATRGSGDAPRFDAVSGRWPLIESADALAVALDVVPEPAAGGARALATWVAAARVRAAVAPYAARLHDWRRRAAVRVPGGPTVAWGDLGARLSTLAGDAATRRALGDARARVAAEALAPLARERVARTCAAVEALGVAAGFDDTFGRLTGEAPAARAALGAAWVALTDAAWGDSLAERARRRLGLPVRELRGEDLPAVLAAGDDAAAVRGSGLAAMARTQLAAMGIDPDAGGRVRAGLFGAPYGEPARALAVRVPGEVYVLTRPSTAPDAARVYLDALGQALHRAHADPGLPFETRWQAGALAALASGALVATLLRERGWLRRYAGLSGAALERAARAAAFRELAAVRAAAARAAVSAAAYGDEVALGDVDAVYVDRTRAALGVAPNPGEAMADVDPPFAVGDRLRGALLAGALAAELRERFDEDWWRNPRAGRWLVSAWFGPGPASRPTVDPGPLAAALTRALE